MKNCLIRILLAITALLTCSSIALAAPVIVDPSAFAPGTDVSTAYTGVTLSTAEGSVTVVDTTVSDPLHLTSSNTTPVFTDGTNFSHSSGSIWSAGQCCGGNEVLRADFDWLVSTVTMDFIPNDVDTGFLQVYDASDNLLGESIFRSGSQFTLSFSSSTSEVAYALATFGDTGLLGTLTFNTAAVPEPGTLGLLLLGLIGFRFTRASS